MGVKDFLFLYIETLQPAHTENGCSGKDIANNRVNDRHA
jgi:hypothetical protein